MELTELAGPDGSPEAKQDKMLANLATVDSLVIDLDRPGVQALLEEMESRARLSEPLVELKALRSFRIKGSLKQWQRNDTLISRLFQMLRPVALEELSLVGVDQLKVVRTVLAQQQLWSTLLSLEIGLHGFHFIAQEDMAAMGAHCTKLQKFRLFGANSNGLACRDGSDRMFIRAAAFLDSLAQFRNPQDMEVLHVMNAGILGDDQQIASILRALACFGRLRVLRLPLPSLPLSLREMLSLRFALPRLLFFFVADVERLEGADEWPDGEDWPPMTQIWPLCETITPISVFAREFADHLAGPSQAVEEWLRLSEAEQALYIEAVPRIREAYRHSEQGCAAVGAMLEEQAAVICGSDTSPLWRAAPVVRELAGEHTGQSADGTRTLDAQHASTHSTRDWRAEERSALRGVLAMRASDVCKEKARLRREAKPPRGSEGLELHPGEAGHGDAGVARAVEEDLDSPREEGEELYADHPQQCCPREQTAVELGDDAAAAVEL